MCVRVVVIVAVVCARAFTRRAPRDVAAETCARTEAVSWRLPRSQATKDVLEASGPYAARADTVGEPPELPLPVVQLATRVKRADGEGTRGCECALRSRM